MNTAHADALEQRLLARRDLAGRRLPAEAVLPDYDGGCLANLSVTVLSHFAAPTPSLPALSPDVLGDRLAGARVLVVLLIDALGYRQLQRAAADAEVGWLTITGGLGPLTSMFPSTTSCCIPSLHTGEPASRHAMPGYRTYLPDRGFVANMITLRPDAGGETFLPDEAAVEAFRGVPTVHQRLRAAGVESHCVMADDISGSGLSRLTHQGATAVTTYHSLADLFVQVRRLATVDGGVRRAVWAYYPLLDTIGHSYGPGDDVGAAEVRTLAATLRRELFEPLRAAGRDDVAILVTADHGQVQVDAPDIIDGRDVACLRCSLTAPPSCGARAGYLFCRPAEVERLATELPAELADVATVLPSAEALAAGLWGPPPVREQLRARVGDYLVLPHRRHAIWWPSRPSSLAAKLIGGCHGGLHAEEMLIPLLVLRP